MDRIYKYNSDASYKPNGGIYLQLITAKDLYIQNITVAEHDGHSDSFQVKFPNVFTNYPLLECYMDWFPSVICKNYIFNYFVKTVEPMSLRFCTVIELIILHLEYTIAHVKYANFSYAYAKTFVLLNGEMATVSTGFRKLKFWLWLLQTVFFLSQTGFWKIY